MICCDVMWCDVIWLNIHCIWVRSRNCGCLVTWFCYELITKPGNKTATVSWPDPYVYELISILSSWLILKYRYRRHLIHTSSTLIGAVLGLAASDPWLVLLCHVHQLFHRILLGWLVYALRGYCPPSPLYPLHCPHGIQPQTHGLDGHMEMLVSSPVMINPLRVTFSTTNMNMYIQFI